MVIRASDAHCRLALTAAHYFSNKLLDDNTDVYSSSRVLISLSGILNNSPVSPPDLLGSQLAQHFVDYLQANATQLGIALLSGLYLDTDGHVKLIVTPAVYSPAGPHLQRAHVYLTAINLKYVWTTTNQFSDARIHPFASSLALPFRLLLDNVIERFCVWQLVKRYPLIFGHWKQQLDVERSFFKKIFRSVSRIATRSNNSQFRNKCARRFKSIQDQHDANFAAASLEDEPVLDDEESLSLSLELCYRTHLRRPRFKGANHSTTANPNLADDSEFSQDLLTPQSSQQFDEEYLWSDATAVPITANPDLLLGCDSDIKPVPIEYQDLSDFWDDSDNEIEDMLDQASPSDDDIRPSTNDESLLDPVGIDRDVSEDDQFALEWEEEEDVDRSADELALSPSALPADYGFEPDLVCQAAFSGLSSKYCDHDLELAFDSDDPDGLCHGKADSPEARNELEHHDVIMSVDGETIGAGEFCGVAGLLEEDEWMAADSHTNASEIEMLKSVTAERSHFVKSSCPPPPPFPLITSFFSRLPLRPNTIMLPAQRNKVDMSKLNEQEQLLFAKYGKLPTHKNVLMKMQKDRKYFDSGDYALSKAGVAPQNAVGTAIPNPENIPHASSPPINGHAGLSTSPTNPTSPVNKESGLAHDDESSTIATVTEAAPITAES
ncbi:hypothetical protein MIND_00870200 [Mycena indigotica]|uniref:mRNA stability protein n=1 Tax=Mycena indigotica TaxID=2126181 RepID=A0A8H6SJY3_9AGAR|nr:uncharacterized protein MIND_00870200 [Mycena indigotica]KAF7299215.1 hypothetical protein MIND_00870200 [Mycena indigotica]